MSTEHLEQDLGGVVRLLEKATPGPWCVATCYQKTNEWPVVRDIAGKMTVEAYSYNKPEDCAAIAAAVNFLRTHSDEIAGALRDAERWQPIETAPKDGRRVMLYDPDRVPSELIAHFANRAWWGDMTNSGRSIVWRDATHWRPLPAPPTQDSAMQQGGGGE